jgi:hypothetical protein
MIEVGMEPGVERTRQPLGSVHGACRVFDEAACIQIEGSEGVQLDRDLFASAQERAAIEVASSTVVACGFPALLAEFFNSFEQFGGRLFRGFKEPGLLQLGRTGVKALEVDQEACCEASGA